eukprot:1060999-Pyramimonas_sp.AAC.1
MDMMVSAPMLSRRPRSAGLRASLRCLRRRPSRLRCPPFLSDPVIVSGRLSAGRVRWGVEGGVIVLS